MKNDKPGMPTLDPTIRQLSPTHRLSFPGIDWEGLQFGENQGSAQEIPLEQNS